MTWSPSSPTPVPVYHALRYLMGDLDGKWLTTLRQFGGLQSYPSRTKDHDRVDFSTGSVGLGAVAPMFAALADQYLRAHIRDEAIRWPDRRFVATVGDAELDEGNVWEAVLEDPLQGLGNVTVLVDLNRQSLDRVVPGIRIRRLDQMFRAAGWQVLEAKYGSRLQAAFDSPGGETLRRRIDEMPNEAYQGLIRRSGAEQRARLLTAPTPATGTASRTCSAGPTTRTCRDSSRTWAATTPTRWCGCWMRPTPTGPGRRSSSRTP